MLVVAGFPAPNARLDKPLGDGTVFVRLGEWVGSMSVVSGIWLAELRLNGAPLPVDAELWFESAEERWH